MPEETQEHPVLRVKKELDWRQGLTPKSPSSIIDRVEVGRGGLFHGRVFIHLPPNDPRVREWVDREWLDVLKELDLKGKMGIEPDSHHAPSTHSKPLAVFKYFVKKP